MVALPGAPRHPLLARGGALRSANTLEAVEAAALVASARSRSRESLAARGRRALAALPSVDAVAERAAEATVLAANGQRRAA